MTRLREDEPLILPTSLTDGHAEIRQHQLDLVNCGIESRLPEFASTAGHGFSQPTLNPESCLCRDNRQKWRFPTKIEEMNMAARGKPQTDGRTVICVAALSGSRDFASGYGKSRFPSLLSLSGTWKEAFSPPFQRSRRARATSYDSFRRNTAVHKYAASFRVPISVMGLGGLLMIATSPITIRDL